MGISFDVQAFMIQVGGMWVTQSVPWSITSMKRDQDKILEMRTSVFFPSVPHQSQTAGNPIHPSPKRYVGSSATYTSM